MTDDVTFNRYGRSYHLRIETAADLALACKLDEAHWVATNAPISTINCDRTFLDLMDTDKNGRIMPHEVKEAIAWLFETLRDTSGVTEGRRTLRCEAVNTDTPDGQQIHAAVRKMLQRLGTGDAEEVTLDQVRQIKAQEESTPVSEAGVVLPQAAEDPEVRQFLTDVIATVGGAAHPSGAQGVGQVQLETFLADAAARLDWEVRGQIPPGTDKTDIMPLGTETPGAYAAFASVRAKLDQYFAQCEASALDERFVQRMGWTDAELLGMDFDDPAVIEEVLQKAPLARAAPARELRFEEGINPYYAAAMDDFCRRVATPILGERPAALSAAAWQEIKGVFAAHQAWATDPPGPSVAPLGAAKLRAYLDERFAMAVRDLIAQSRETAFVLDNIRLTEKLLLYQAYMIPFANNFVSFPHLYDATNRAMFEMGTLVMDGRRFNLAVKSEDRNRHAAVAKTSNMYVLYVEVVGPDGGAKYEVAVPVTSGGKGNLCVGKRGVFQDVHGVECDATVVGLIENPISVREAMVSPFLRLGRLLTGKIESIATQAEKRLDATATGAMSQAAPGPGAPPPSRMATGGMLMGAGVAVAALGSALAYITKTLAETRWWAILIGVLAA
ncbi:MAG TPA: hypothetical protein VMZ50_05130, partial [Phycisphaerae bacterium]|nr:hypothetical protein [Phycisphaerae bacterium]